MCSTKEMSTFSSVSLETKTLSNLTLPVEDLLENGINPQNDFRLKSNWQSKLFPWVSAGGGKTVFYPGNWD